MSSGVLNQKQMWALILSENRRITGYCNKHKGPGESAIDLPLGRRYWKLKSSCRPAKGQSIQELLSKHGDAAELLSSTVLDVGGVYVMEVPWTLILPQNVRARATAKSTIGRLGALVRLLVDGHEEYDRIPPGRETNLYIEIIPTTFPILVQEGTRLSQLRFIKGDPEDFVLPSRKLMFEDTPVLTQDTTDGRYEFVDLGNDSHREGILLGLNLNPDPTIKADGKAVIGFVAKQNAATLPPIDPDKAEFYNPQQYWDPVTLEDQPDKDQVLIRKDRFYIFRSLQRFCVPSHLAVECQAYSESLGDIRIHYAGFAHPFFGQQRRDRKPGAPLIFEVRGFNFDSTLRHNTPLARVQFWRMCSPADPGDMSYGDQELKLSNCFRPCTEWTPPRDSGG